MSNIAHSLCFVTLIAVCLTQLSAVEGTACSKTDRANNENPCLQKINESFQDRDRFWFGYNYGTRCPPHLAYTIDCNNPRGHANDSIASILFKPASTFDLATIDRYISLEYISKPGEYTGCGHHFVRETTEVIEIDPLSEVSIKSWDARDVPEMTWRVDTGKQYALIIQDVGGSSIHGLYINIPGNDLVKAETIITYAGPLVMRDIPNPYAFVLYEQQINNMVSPTYAPVTQPQQIFSIPEYASMASLTGPIAVNWISASFDPYSVQATKDERGLENCATFISKAMENEMLPFINKDSDLPLNTYMEVTIAADALDFTFCCQENKFKAGSFVVDPVANSIISTTAARTNSSVTFKINKNKINANVSADFKNSYLTVIMVDPDVSAPAVATTEKPLLHYLAYNFRVNHEGLLVNGETAFAYGGPAPPNTVHRYVFVLFFQKNKLDSLQSTDYTGSCEERLQSRCLFDINKLQTENMLTLISATFFRATRDMYAALQWNDTDYCNVVQGGNPCDKNPSGSTSGCEGLVQTLNTWLLAAAVSMFATQLCRLY